MHFLQPILMQGGNYIREGKDSHKSTAIIFSLKEEVGALAKALKIFDVSLHIILFFEL